ncbi:MAG: ABC transporter ATP-binding protein [Armatimonadetes bacterium]|nr:ABC transporter ATP-binding protein [Armatimonadota bacterium]
MIRTVNLSKRLGEFQLLEASVTIEEGEYFVLLGPTGAGKTIFVECIAGIYQPDGGSVLIGEENVTHLRPEERRLGYVPQDYSLFPHLSVEQNIGFGLTVRRESPAVIAERTRELSDLLGITPLLRRPIRTLSGGERQRVALARALAIRPRVLLLDEPLSAVDEQTREALCAELRRIHEELRTTTIHVSHNFEETLAVADRIGVIRGGVVQQIGSPDDIFRRPANAFVAGFVRADNILSGVASPTPEGAAVGLGNGAVVHSCRRLSGPVTLVVRPEDVEVLGGPPGPDVRNCFAGAIRDTLDRGATVKLWVESEPAWASLVLRPRWQAEGLRRGARVWLRVPPESVHLFPAEEANGQEVVRDGA